MTMNIDEEKKNQLVQELLEVIEYDRNAAESLLTSCDWNLEHSLSLYFTQIEEIGPRPAVVDHNGSSECDANVSQQNATSSSERLNQNGLLLSDDEPSQEVARPSPSLLSVVASVVCLGQALTRSFASWISTIPLFFKSLLTGLWTSNLQFGTLSFDRYYETTYGTPKPQFAVGDFLEACQLAKSLDRLLLVYIHDNSQTTPLALFSDEVFLDIASQFCVIWGTLSFRPEAFVLKRRLVRSSEVPSLAILCPKKASLSQNDLNFSTSLLMASAEPLEGFQLIGTVQGPSMDKDQVLALIGTGLDEVMRQELEVKRKNDQVEKDRVIRLEQDKAYQEALLKDLERSRKEKEEILKLSEQEEAEKTLQKEKKKQKKILLIKELEEKQKESGIRYMKNALQMMKEDSTSKDRLKVRVRTPDGQRLETEFHSSSTLNLVCQWLDAIATACRYPNPEDYLKEALYSSSENPTTNHNDCDTITTTTTTLDSLFEGIAMKSKKVVIPLTYYLSTPYPIRRFLIDSEEDMMLPLNTLGPEVVLFLHKSPSNENNS